MTAPADDAALSARADGWLALGLTTVPADRADAEAGVRQAYELAGLAAPDRIEWCGSPAAGARTAHELVTSGETGASVRSAVRTRPWASARADLVARLGPAGWARHWAAAGARTWQLLTDRLVTPIRVRVEADLEPLAGARFQLLDAVYGQHDGAWLAAFDAPQLAGRTSGSPCSPSARSR
jgi:hypothetical protein